MLFQGLTYFSIPFSWFLRGLECAAILSGILILYFSVRMFLRRWWNKSQEM